MIEKKCKMTRGGGLRVCRVHVAVALSGLMCAIMCGSAGEFVCNVLIHASEHGLCMYIAAMDIVHGYIFCS